MVTRGFNLLLVVALILTLVACATPTPEVVTKEVIKEVKVTEQVKVNVPVTVTPPPPAPVEKQLTIYHWWTAGGERQAIDKLFEWFKKKNPDYKVVDNPTAGGGGITLQTVLNGMLAAKIPPDTFQSLSGAAVKSYVDGNYLDPVDDVWKAQNLDTNYPAVISKMTIFNGKHYAIPMLAHRANWLFYNKKLFDELKLTPPTTVDELITVSKAIKAAKPDVWPIGIGTRDMWMAVFLFDVTLLNTAGPDVYEKFYTGQIDPKSDPSIRAALEKYKQLLPYMYPNHGGKDWSDIPGPLCEGKFGMMVIGDFGAANMVNAGYKQGEVWDAVGFPKKPEEVFLMIVDTFVRPTGIKHLDAANLWLNNLTDPKVQGEFTIIKGAIAIHKDVPDSNYPDKLHQEASATFKSKRIVPSSVHGQLATPALRGALETIFPRFLYSPDVDRALGELSDAMTLYKVKENSEWYWAK